MKAVLFVIALLATNAAVAQIHLHKHGNSVTPPVSSNCILIAGTTTNCLLISGTTTNALLVK